jgi:hypothetical protein
VRGGELELPDEDFLLLGERGAAQAGEAGIVGLGTVEDPAVEADLADAGARFGGETGFEPTLPVGGTRPNRPAWCR